MQERFLRGSFNTRAGAENFARQFSPPNGYRQVIRMEGRKYALYYERNVHDPLWKKQFQGHK